MSDEDDVTMCDYCLVREAESGRVACDDCGRWDAYWNSLTVEEQRVENEMMARFVGDTSGFSE